MNDFLDLEKRCKKLQKKRMIKYLSIAGGVIILLITIPILFKDKPKPQPQKIEKPKITHPKPVKKETKKTIVPPMMEVEFDLNKIKDVNIEEKKKQKKPHHKKEVKPKHTTKKEIKKETKKTGLIVEEKITFDKALYLATNAFNKHNYQESIKWCKIASKLNNDNPEIWRLYALNLVRLGQKDKAIIVLQTYLKYKKSIKIQHLLKRLQK